MKFFIRNMYTLKKVVTFLKIISCPLVLRKFANFLVIHFYYRDCEDGFKFGPYIHMNQK